MKKLTMICLVIAMALSMTISVAAAGGFVSSPSANQAPVLVPNENSVPMTVTSYADRNDLSSEACQLLEEAYAKIVGTTDVSTLNPQIAEIAAALGIDVAGLAVSDLFDLSPEAEDYQGGSVVSLKAETLGNFVCLLHYHNGAWEIVEDAKLSEDGQQLDFSVDAFSPFAIVVNTGSAPLPMDDNTVMLVSIVTASILVAGAIAIGLYLSKTKQLIR